MGTDHTAFFETFQNIKDKTNPKAPMAIQTPLGWTCIGVSSDERLNEEAFINFQNVFSPSTKQ